MSVRVERRKVHQLDIWPGFVDAFSSLLIVIIFVLMTFVVAQFALSVVLNDKDQTLNYLNEQIEKLAFTLQGEQKSKEAALHQVTSFQQAIDELKKQLGLLNTQLVQAQSDLNKEQSLKTDALSRASSLSAQIEDLKNQLIRLSNALAEEEKKDADQRVQIDNLNNRLNEVLLSKVEELKALNEQLLNLKGENDTLNDKIKEKDKKEKSGLGHFRSEFFAKLTEILGKRNDIRVVGDRFVFQSEVLFDKASAELGKEGQKQLNQLARALKEITTKIPKSINWILRIDGHTDQLPIATSQFPSNWELSAARAIAVVKYLVSQGISSHHLVAAGFGEHQPLQEGKNEKDLARNRRIEFKLDQR